MEYRQHQSPGCGGCLFVAALLILITGGAPALINFIGWIFFSGLFGIFIFIAFFWGFSYWLQRRVADYTSSQTESHNRFVWLLINILIHIAKIDGTVTKEEISTIHNFFQYNLRYSQTQMAWVKKLIKEAIDADPTIDELLQEFKSGFAYEPRLILLELIYQIAHTKDPVPQKELQIARKIAAYLEISEYDLRTIEAKYTYRKQQAYTTSKNNAEKHYATLGLEPGADK
jgi:DnaJ like chaperone protein